jgi:putative endonuclease
LSPAGCRPIVVAMTQAKDAVGAYGERVALAHLVDQGMVVLDRNWRCRTGEIDLILRDGSDLVFCEVKTRRTTRFGTPVEAVDETKVRRLRQLAAQWLAEAGLRPGGVRFDVVSVLPQRSGAARVEHVRGAF